MRVARAANETWRQARKASCAAWMARSVSDHVIAGTSFNLVPVAGLMTGKLDLIARCGLSCMGGPFIYPLTLDLVDASMLPAVELTAVEFTLQPRSDLQEQFKPLTSQRGFQDGKAGGVPVRTVKPHDEAAGNRVDHIRKDDRDRPRLPLLYLGSS